MAVRVQKTAKAVQFIKPVELSLTAYNAAKKTGLKVLDKPNTSGAYINLTITCIVSFLLFILPFVYFAASGELEKMSSQITFDEQAYQFSVDHNNLIKSSGSYDEYVSKYKHLVGLDPMARHFINQ